MPLGPQPRRIWFLVLLVVFLVVGLGSIYRRRLAGVAPADATRNEPSAATVAPQTPLSAEDEFATAVDREISQLDGAITRGQWKAAHPEDRAPRDSTDQISYTCPDLEKTDTLSSGAQLKRIAYFYPPATGPSTVAMPTLSGEALIDSSCTLAMIRVEVPAPTSEGGHALAESVRTELSKKNDAPETRLPRGVAFYGASYWQETMYWKASETEIIAAYDSGKPSGEPAEFFVFARLPIVGAINYELGNTITDYHYRPGENQMFHSAVALSGLDEVLRQRMDRLYEQVYAAYVAGAGRPSNTNWRAALIPTLTDWMNAQQALAPAQHAAALFAADRLVAAVEDADAGELGRKTSALRADLEKIGATFSVPEVGYAYTKNLLKQAIELAPESAAGRMAVLAIVSRGGCDYTGWDSEKAISEAEALLAKGVDQSTETHLHFILGDAYSDIVALGLGDDPDIGDNDKAKYASELDAARAKALDHYRTAFSADATSDTAREAWRQAWHLAAGLVPKTRYHCGDI